MAAAYSQPIRDAGSILEKLHQYGYFFCDAALRQDLVDKNDVSKLDLNHAIAKCAVEEYQRWFKDSLDIAGQNAYRRPLHADGDLGAITENELFAPRCPFPDYPHPSLGYLDVDGNSLGKPEEANHPESCRREMTKSLENGYRLPGATFEELMEWERVASSRWTDHFQIGIRIDNSLGRNANRWVIAWRLGGSVLADQYLAQNRCDAKLRGRYDNDRTWNRRLYLPTAVHEEGHFWGCPHIRHSSAIMYPSIHNESMNREGQLHAADIRLMESLGYSRRTGPPPPPEPDEVPTVREMNGMHISILAADGLSQWSHYKLVEAN